MVVQFSCYPVDCVIKGTPLLIPPASGGKIRGADYFKENSKIDSEVEDKEEWVSLSVLSNQTKNKMQNALENWQNTFKFKNIENIKIGELVIDHNGVLRPVQKILKYHYKGLVVGIKTEQNNSIWLTHNHLVLSERSVKKCPYPGDGVGLKILNLKEQEN